MTRLWKQVEPPADAFEALRVKTGIPDLLLKIMWNRNLRDPIAIERYFEPRSRYLGSPFLLDGVYAAVNRIGCAIVAGERIRVYGDRDVDGITSTVVLLETLRSFTTKVDYTVPVIEDGYGLNREYLNTAKRDGVGLIVTVDCGISNIDEIEYARTLGIDVIVTDHHEPPNRLPQAVAIIDPKQPGSLYPHKDLAGVGVALKLSMALVLAQGKSLAVPLIAFNVEGDEITALRFSPREGFSTQKALDPHHLVGATLLFWDAGEREIVYAVLPQDKRGYKSVLLSALRAAYTPDMAALDKEGLAAELKAPPGFDRTQALTLMYLKFLEAIEPGVKALWQRALDILTIGTIADMVPMRAENRTISQLGLKFITRTKRLGLLELFTLLGWHNKRISERDVSFSIAPILNSSGRLRSAELAIDLLSTEFPPRAKSLAAELLALNGERKRLAEEGYRFVREHLFLQNDLANDKILLVHAPMPNQGVTGIVATRLMLDFCRPVIVVLEDHGKLLGSARSYRSINIINALNSASDLLDKYGGHIGAAGLTLKPENLEGVRSRLRAYSREHITDEELSSEWIIEAEISVDMVTETFLNDLLKFAPFGVENPQPLFVARGALYYEIKKVGETKGHLRFKFRKSTGQPIFGIGFNLGKLMPVDVVTDGVCDVVFSVEPNDYNGNRTVQLVVHDVLLPEEVLRAAAGSSNSGVSWISRAGSSASPFPPDDSPVAPELNTLTDPEVPHFGTATSDPTNSA
ncbi:MAG: single-stranded-DNA-specific exonuclease RecJ [Candidatus Ozemobacteraceae bacterium]